VKKVGYLIFQAMISNYANRKFNFSSFRAYQTRALKTRHAKDSMLAALPTYCISQMATYHILA
jgi:type III secretory pathway component EscR